MTSSAMMESRAAAVGACPFPPASKWLSMLSARAGGSPVSSLPPLFRSPPPLSPRTGRLRLPREAVSKTQVSEGSASDGAVAICRFTTAVL